MPHHNLADFEHCLGYATEGEAVGGIPMPNTLKGPQFHPQPQPFHFAVGRAPPAMAEKGNKEGENEGETRAATAIPIQPSFPPTQQCRYSANNKPSHYLPPSYPQRPSLNQPQSPPSTQPMLNTTFGTNQNSNQGRNFAAKKPVEFTPILVSYANLLYYLLDTAMVAITPARFPQPPFFQGYDSNAMCAYHGGAPGHSTKLCRALKRKVQSLIDAGWLKFEENCL
ncbi:hypothetical protein HKD37_20G056257 [Glycine soja]